MTKEKTLFPKVESTKEIQDKFDKLLCKQMEYIMVLETALRKAAEAFYQSEMIDTNMAVLEIAEEAEKYEFYSSKEERQRAFENCQWATKEEWIEEKIDEWV